MVYILLITWYFVGFFSGLFLSKKLHPEVTNRDLIFLFTIGGIGGLLTFFIGLTYLLKR